MEVEAPHPIWKGIMRIRFWAPCLVCAVLAFSGHPPVSAQARHAELKQTEFGTGVKTGFGLVQYHDTCVTFQVFFISGNFFNGLREYETPEGTEFRNEKTTYRNFPDQLVVDVEGFAVKCTPRAGEITPPDYAAGLMEGASFEVSWKRGDEIRPVVLLSTQERHQSPGIRWYYFLTIPSNNVPLTDSLVIDVSLRHGMSHTKLTANLKSRLD